MAHKAGIFVIIRKYFFSNRIMQQTKYTLHWNNISCISVYMCCYVYLISGGWTVKKSFKTKKSLITDMTTATIWSIFFSLCQLREKRSDRALTNRKVIRWSLLLKLLHHIRVLRQPRNVTAPPLMAWQNTRSWHLMCSIYTLT